MDHPAWSGGAYWGEPLFGYYMTEDEWVIRKHIEMLGFADVDFLVFDTTNRVIFYDQVTKIMSLLEEYLNAGYPVPKVVFYTNLSLHSPRIYSYAVSGKRPNRSTCDPPELCFIILSYCQDLASFKRRIPDACKPLR
jgi:hypothetical protein